MTPLIEVSSEVLTVKEHWKNDRCKQIQDAAFVIGGGDPSLESGGILLLALFVVGIIMLVIS